MNVGVGDAINLAKAIGNLVKDGMTVEAQEKIVELRKKIVEIESSILNMQEENRNLRRALETKDNLQFDNGVYWKGSERSEMAGPFCARCHDKDGKMCRMHKEQYAFRCLSCDLYVYHTEPPAPTTAETEYPMFGPRPL